MGFCSKFFFKFWILNHLDLDINFLSFSQSVVLSSPSPSSDSSDQEVERTPPYFGSTAAFSVDRAAAGWSGQIDNREGAIHFLTPRPTVDPDEPVSTNSLQVPKEATERSQQASQRLLRRDAATSYALRPEVRTETPPATSPIRQEER